MITYRDGPDVDLGSLAQLRAACGFYAVSRATLAGQIAGARWVVAAYDDDRLVGFARAISDGVTNAYVSSVMIGAKYRRRGIGRELMRRLMAGRDGMRWVLHARGESKAFYESVGFSAASDMMWAGRH